jgi:hypothetical protein
MISQIRANKDGTRSHYILDDEKDKIVVEAPMIVWNEKMEFSVELKKFEIPNGKKAKFIRLFFKHHSSVIQINEKKYDLEDVLLDEVEIPVKSANIDNKHYKNVIPVNSKKSKTRSSICLEPKKLLLQGSFRAEE